MMPTSWEFASLACKILLYLGIAAVAGGSLSLCLYTDGSRRILQSNFHYILLGAMLGFQAVVANYLIQVGLINDSGLGGMFDWDMASLLLDTPLGDSTFWRLLGFALALTGSSLFLRKINSLSKPPQLLFFRQVVLVNGFAVLILAYSFKLAGHVSVLETAAQAAVMLHLITISLWVGALYPLWSLTRLEDLATLHHCMRRFGNHAIGIVLVLIVAGVVMSLDLVQSFQELFGTPYGLMLVAKLTLVIGILAIAALNRLYLVPKLIEDSGAVQLGRSIRIEMAVASLILMVTSYFSTIVGPANH